MYLAVDIGGTKTLLAAFNAEGQQVSRFKFPTPENYDEFLSQLAANLPQLGDYDYQSAVVAVPGRLDRPHGRVIALGNLPWRNEDIDADLEGITHCPVEIENDAKLAGLSEALILKDEFKRVLYLTFSTGIGIALISDGQIDTNVGDVGGDGILLEHEGKLMPWEDFASGKALVAKYGKRASDIDDPEIWRAFVRDMAIGMIDLIAVLQPGVIVIGGGVGANFIKFGDLLIERLKSYETPMMSIPPVRPAVRAEEAVVYGCFELARSRNQ